MHPKSIIAEKGSKVKQDEVKKQAYPSPNARKTL